MTERTKGPIEPPHWAISFDWITSAVSPSMRPEALSPAASTPAAMMIPMISRTSRPLSQQSANTCTFLLKSDTRFGYVPFSLLSLP